MDINYILTELGEDREKYFNAISPPIIKSSNFVFPTVAEFQSAILDEQRSHVYTRGNNPTVEILRKKMAALEKMEDAIITASGIAAISSSVLAFVGQGDHIICIKDPYSWANTLMNQYLPRFGVSVTFVDGTNMEEIIAAKRKETKLLYLESPNTYTFSIQDLSACGKWAKDNGIISIIDNSYSSPIFQRPSEFGIDIVTHSASKYINGHSDIVAGVICGSKKHIAQIFMNEYMNLGAIISPTDAAEILRSLRTLPIRLERIQKTAKVVIDALKNHAMVDKILYPFDPDFAQYELAIKQMSGCGGLFTMAVKADSVESVIKFIDGLSRFKLAVSWGGHESLILPIAAMYGLPGRKDPKIPFNYMRVYVGLEDAEYLLEEILPALDAIE